VKKQTKDRKKLKKDKEAKDRNQTGEAERQRQKLERQERRRQIAGRRTRRSVSAFSGTAPSPSQSQNNTRKRISDKRTNAFWNIPKRNNGTPSRITIFQNPTSWGLFKGMRKRNKLNGISNFGSLTGTPGNFTNNYRQYGRLPGEIETRIRV